MVDQNKFKQSFIREIEEYKTKQMTRHFEFFTGLKISPVSKCTGIKVTPTKFHSLDFFSIGKDRKFQIRKFNSCNTNCFSVYIQICATANMWAFINATVNSPVDEKHNKNPSRCKNKFVAKKCSFVNLKHKNIKEK